MGLLNVVKAGAKMGMGSLLLKINEIKSKKKSGFFDLDNPKIICNDPNHNPPAHVHIPPGKGYHHICPTCGTTKDVIPQQVTL